MNHERNLDLQQCAVLRQDMIIRGYIRTAVSVPNLAGIAKASASRHFEMGDHQPDGRVIYRHVAGAVGALEQALQNPYQRVTDYQEDKRRQNIAPLFNLANDRH